MGDNKSLPLSVISTTLPILKDAEIEPNPKLYTYSTGSWCRTT
jgi:hypothetical protein